MAQTLDLAPKKKQRQNSGYAKSHFDFSRIVGIILTPKDFTINKDDLAMSELTDAAKAADINDRIFALPAVVGYTAQDTEDKKVTFGYGAEHYSNYGTYQGMFQFSDSKKALQKVLTQFNGRQNDFKAFLVDENGLLYCTLQDDETIVGFSLSSIWTPKWKFAAENPTQLEIFIAFANAKEFNEDIHFADMGGDIMGSVPPITDVFLDFHANTGSPNTVTFHVRTGDNEESLLDDYGTELAATSAWSAKVYDTGAAITISAAALLTVNGEKAIKLTMTTNYPSTGSQVSIQGAALSVWEGLGVIGFENNEPITYTV